MTITVGRTTATYDSPIGRLHLQATDAGLIRCHVREGLATVSGGAAAADWLRRTAEQLDQYFASTRTDFDVPIDWTAIGLRATDVSVLDGLAGRVGHGRTTSYGALARLVGAEPDDDHPSPAQRVGAVLAANPVLVVVPCHRVVAAGGGLTGYAAGLLAKRRLLDLEQAQQSLDLTFPTAGTST